MKKGILNIFMSALVLMTSSFAMAQPGAIDPTFNPTDAGFDYLGLDSTVHTAAIQPDGKIVIGGKFTSFDGLPVNRIARLNADGTLDNTFDPGIGASFTVRTISIQPDGKIIVGGEFFEFNGLSVNRIVRLNTDGSIDDTFDMGTGANNAIHTTAIQTDGKIIIAGHFWIYNGETRNTIARLNADGSLDDTFDPGEGASYTIHSTAIQSDGKIIIGGQFVTFDGWPRNRIARLNPDGSLDTTFNTEIGANNTVHTASIQSDGKIVIGGEFTSLNGTSRIRIARLNDDGSLDDSFDTGTGAYSYPTPAVYTTSIQPDGKIIFGGQFANFNSTPANRIARLNSDGTLDETFDVGAGANNIVYTTLIQPDGKIVIGGELTHYSEITRYRIVRLNAGGSIDTTFNPDTGASNTVYTTTVQPDGKIIIGGAFASFNGIPINRIVRINSDGSLDETFDPGSGANGVIHSASIQSDGKIIIGGNFTSFDGTPINRIARLNIDGSLDESFNPGIGVSGSGVNTTIYCMSYQPDGKILIGGLFYQYNGVPRSCIARLNSDGTLDNTFDPGTGANSSNSSQSIRSISLQPDGKIIITGRFNTFNGLNRISFARLNSDGSIDPAFFPGSGAQVTPGTDFPLTLYASAIQSDGKVLLGGRFNYINGVNSKSIVRLNANGIVDTSFDTANGVTADSFNNREVHTISIQSDGKVIIGGTFTGYGGESSNHIARLHIDGSFDESFNVGSGANSHVRSSAIQPDGKIIIAGEFTSYDDTGRNRIARILDACIPTTATDSIIACDSYTWIDGVDYSSNNDTATHVLINAVGCDSIVTLNLTINNSTSDTSAHITCDSYTWSVNGETYSETGTYTATSTNEDGCTHTEVLNLTNNSTSNTTVESACESFTWSINEETYSESGVYTVTSINEDNCTHTETLNLTINSTTSDSTYISACDAYTWPVNNQTYSSSGEYIEILTNDDGCTHTEVLNLSIDNSTSNTTTETGCDSYTWSINGQTYTESGNYEEVDGCHTEELILTVYSVDASIVLDGITLSANTSNADYQWLDCDNGNAPITDETNQSFTPSSNGNYAVTITQNNCSSTSECVFVDVSVGIYEQHEDFLVVYPNPGSGMFFIESSLKGEFSVINILGQTMTTFELNGRNTQTINLQHLESGIYLLVSNTDHKTLTKIVLNK